MIMIKNIIKKVGKMGNSSCRYVITALGKKEETYLTHCQNRKEVEKWITENKEKIKVNELKIYDKSKNPFLKLFSLKK